VCGIAVISMISRDAFAEQTGIASVYGYVGELTANGERLTSHGLTAAHRTLPLGSSVTITNELNGRSVVVRINDRGPFVNGRIIDVTAPAARVLGLSGLDKVRITPVGKSLVASHSTRVMKDEVRGHRTRMARSTGPQVVARKEVVARREVVARKEPAKFRVAAATTPPPAVPRSPEPQDKTLDVVASIATVAAQREVGPELRDRSGPDQYLVPADIPQ